MNEMKDYPTLVDSVYKVVQEAPENQGQIHIASIAAALNIPRDSKACAFGIAEAMRELVSLGYCIGHEEFNGHYVSLSVSPDAPVILPSDYPNQHGIDELLPLHKKILNFIHVKSVCHEYSIEFYNQNIDIAVQDALEELMPTGAANAAALEELSTHIQDLVNSGSLAGVPFPENYSLRPVGLLDNEINMYVERRIIFPPEIYFKDTHFLAKIIATGRLRLWLTLRGASRLYRTSSLRL